MTGGQVGRERGHRRTPRHVRHQRQRRHLRATAGWSARSPCPAARRGPTAATSTRWSTGWPRCWAPTPSRRRVERVVVVPRRADPAHPPASTCRCRPGAARRRRRCASNCAAASRACTTPSDAGRELHAVLPLMSITHNRRVQLEVACPDADPHVPSLFSRLSDLRLARARDLRLLRHHLRRPPRADPHRDARRLGGPPAAQGLPAGRGPGGVPRRPDPAAGRAQVVPLMSEHVEDPGSTPAPPAGRRHRSGRQDWDEIVAAARWARPANASWSTWARSTRPPTACCG